MTQSVAIIDYGMGNLHSVASAVSHEMPDAKVLVTHDATEILQADHVKPSCILKKRFVSTLFLAMINLLS